MKEGMPHLIFYEVSDYIYKSWNYVSPILVFISSVVSYILLPDQAYVPPTIGLMGALILDVLSKYLAISKQNGGFWNAVRTRKISSESMWRGTYKKLISILVVMICCGLLVRFTLFLPGIASTVTTIAYGFMFYCEVQSVLENMMDAGYDDLNWFLKLIKRRQAELFDERDPSASSRSDPSDDPPL